jgi:hypothetical protein
MGSGQADLGLHGWTETVSEKKKKILQKKIQRHHKIEQRNMNLKKIQKHPLI